MLVCWTGECWRETLCVCCLWYVQENEQLCVVFQPVDIRFIEYMPFDGNQWNLKRFVSYQQMLDRIYDRWPDLSRLQDGPNDTSKASDI